MADQPCNRAGCEEIRCSRLNDKYGYICADCFRELVALGPVADIAEFLESGREGEVVNIEASTAYYNSLFPTAEERIKRYGLSAFES